MQLRSARYEVADDHQQMLAAKHRYTGIVPQELLCCALERWAGNFHNPEPSDVLSSEALHKACSPCGIPAERAARHGLFAPEIC
jgi:hypothetical protein